MHTFNTHDVMRQICPARLAKCRRCGEISVVANNEPDVFLGAITEKTSDLCKTHVSLDGREVEWRIDTGADVSAIPEEL